MLKFRHLIIVFFPKISKKFYNIALPGFLLSLKSTNLVSVIIAGFVNQHNFDPGNAAAINYARIGSVIGHEM
jgi:hypothetical protein